MKTNIPRFYKGAAVVLFVVMTGLFNVPASAKNPLFMIREREVLPQKEDDFNIHENSLGIAWGDPDGPHSVYAWPFSVVQMGHAIQSYQNYSAGISEAYFHHGIDMIAPYGTDVFSRSGGQVVNVENYRPRWNLYWEVAILDSEGYVWQFHHIEEPTIPQLIWDKFAEWQLDPVNGGFVPPDTYIGDIIEWPVWSFGYQFNHIHLNILAAGDVYLNTIEFHTPLNDIIPPEIQAIGLLNGNSIVGGNVVSGNYGLYTQARDLFLSDVYYLPPYKVDFAVDGGEWTTVWEFHDLPGGASNMEFVNDFFVPYYTCGNYDCRDFYIDLGFTPMGQRVFPNQIGDHEIEVRVWDFNGNSDTDLFDWTVVANIPDNGCATGDGVISTFTIPDDWLVTDVNLGVNITHATRGELMVAVKAPDDTSQTSVIASSADAYNNYDVWLDDASLNPIDDGSDDPISEPYFDRTAGPSQDGNLDSFNGKSAQGTWTIFICDNAAGSTGRINQLALEIIGAPENTAPIAFPQVIKTCVDRAVSITLTGTDAEGDPLIFDIDEEPVNGNLEGLEPNLVYTPNPSFIGRDHFTFNISDGNLVSDPAIITILINACTYLPLLIR